MPTLQQKIQDAGLQKHEASCKKHNDIEKEQEAFALEYEQDQRRGESSSTLILNFTDGQRYLL
jgi:hypothetical protein